MSRLKTNNPTLLPQDTQEIVDALIANGDREEAEELTLSAQAYLESHNYYGFLTGLGHLSIGEVDE